MRNAQINEAFVKRVGSHLARIAQKKIANHISTSMESHFLFANLVEIIQQVDVKRSRIDQCKIKINRALSTSINFVKQIMTVYFVRTMEQDISYAVNLVQHKFSNNPNIKGKPLFIKLSPAYKGQLKPRTPCASWSNGFDATTNRQLYNFLCAVLATLFGTRSQKLETLPCISILRFEQT